MSLAVLADHLASKGRNGDTMLVHMTPDEVRGLHALALAHGGKLTINPETGLPEANFLKKLLPMIAGMALNFIAPGVGTAIGSALGGLSGAVGTGILVGGVTGLATGSLKQGILAGLGAYGGASLAGGLMGAAGAEGTAAALGVEGAATGAGSQAAMLAEQTAGFGAEGLQKLAESAGYAKGAAPSLTPAFTAGIKGLGTETGRKAFMEGVGGTSGLMKAGYGTALSMDALGQPKTTTQQPDMPAAYGLPASFDPITGRYYEREPIRINTGGIVALADGGTPDPTQQGTPTAAQLEAQKSILGDPQAAALAAARSGVAKGFTDQQIADMVNQQYGKTFSAQNVADFLKANEIFRPTTGGGETGGGGTGGGGLGTGVRPPAIDYTKAPTMREIRSQYEKGGGSTGDQQIGTVLPGQNVYTQNTVVKALYDYMAKNPGASYDALKAAADRLGVPDPQFNAALNEYRFNSLTGGSGQAYDYLMGRGAYPVKPFSATGELMSPYAEFVLGAPVDIEAKRFLFDPATQKYVPNPKFVERKSTVESYGPTDLAGNKLTGNTFTYFAANPDVYDRWKQGDTGMSADEYAKFHWETFGQKEGRKGWTVTTGGGTGTGAGAGDSQVNIGGGAGGGLANIISASASHGGQVDRYNLGGYSDGGRLLRGPGDGVSDSIPATIGDKQPARLADGEFVVPARIVSEIGNGSTEAGARKLYAMMDRVQRARAKTTGKGRVARDTKAERYLPA